MFQSPPRLFAIKPRWRHHGAKEFNFIIINLLIVNLTIGAIYLQLSRTDITAEPACLFHIQS